MLPIVIRGDENTLRGSQLELFIADGTQSDLQERVESNHLPVKHSTFLGGLASRVHRWFRLTPSFGPELVRKALLDMETRPHSVVLDPFSGAGTTLIEAKCEGHYGVGFEINPLLHFVCETSTRWDLDRGVLEQVLNGIKARFDERRSALTGASIEDSQLQVPPIHNVYRWWRPDVLKDMLILLESVRACCKDKKYSDFFNLSLAGVLVPDLTNVTLGRLQLHFINRDPHDIDVWRTFARHTRTMISDLSEVQAIPEPGQARVFHVDSTAPALSERIPPVDRVVTSPPYPNRYSYVWNTRPHLYLLGFLDNARGATEIDLKTIGGTWGTATSILMKGKVEPAMPVIAREVGPIVEEIRRSDNLMANYVMKYFNLLAQQIAAQDSFLAPKAQLAYVVGCSRIRDVYVETDVLLGKIFEGMGCGYTVSTIERFRRRHSGKDLHESTVYVRKE